VRIKLKSPEHFLHDSGHLNTFIGELKHISLLLSDYSLDVGNWVTVMVQSAQEHSE
jgi:hypothetical protein